MPLLSDNDLGWMRDALEESLPGTAILKTPTFVSNAGGGGTATFTASGTVSCRVAPLGGSEREVASRVTEDTDWMITLPAETPIGAGDRIETNGGSFSVVHIRAPRSYEVSRRVECRELT